jgi:hypothetical protein
MIESGICLDSSTNVFSENVSLVGSLVDLPLLESDGLPEHAAMINPLTTKVMDRFNTFIVDLFEWFETSEPGRAFANNGQQINLIINSQSSEEDVQPYLARYFQYFC